MNPDLLSQLRDIHASAVVSWWPPAPGWWLLALLLLAVLAWLGRRLTLRYQLHKRRQQMLAWIEHLDTTIDPQLEPQAYLSTLNRVFKLVALRAFPGERCAVMTGVEWTEFLRDKIKANQPASALSVMASGPYDPAVKFEPGVIRSLARHWIRQYG